MGERRDEDTKPREPGCLCTWEEGDSPCPVHGMDEDPERAAGGEEGRHG